MKLLSISSASDVLSLSIVEGEKILNLSVSKGNRQHAEFISPEIKKLLHSSNLKLSDLDGICINLGPGSFTGLRVGLSTAKGIAFGANLKLFGYTNFEELLYHAIRNENIQGKSAVVIPSRKNEIYFGAFEVNNNKFYQLDVFELMTIDELKTHSNHFDFLITENRISQLLKMEIQNIEIISVENNSYYGALIIQENPLKYLCENYFYLEPLYLKNFDVRLKK